MPGEQEIPAPVDIRNKEKEMTQIDPWELYRRKVVAATIERCEKEIFAALHGLKEHL